MLSKKLSFQGLGGGGVGTSVKTPLNTTEKLCCRVNLLVQYI